MPDVRTLRPIGPEKADGCACAQDTSVKRKYLVQSPIPAQPPPAFRLAEEVPNVDTKRVGDAQQPAKPSVSGAGLDALDRQPLDAGQVAESFLG